jgi:hypothetical protein
MGVMLALDRPRPPRSRRHGHHARTVLARRLLPAAAALAEAVGAVLAEDSRSGGRVAIDVTASPALLAWERVGRADLRSCQSCAGEHGGRGDPGEPGRGGTPAA